MMKRCPICGESKPRTPRHFRLRFRTRAEYRGRGERVWYEFFAWCRPCESRKVMDRRRRNGTRCSEVRDTEMVRERNRIHYAENREKILARQRAYREKKRYTSPGREGCGVPLPGSSSPLTVGGAETPRRPGVTSNHFPGAGGHPSPDAGERST